MSQEEILTRAKQGDPTAIEFLINQALKKYKCQFIKDNITFPTSFCTFLKTHEKMSHVTVK